MEKSLTMQNQQLEIVAGFLNSAVLKGKASLGRSRLIKLINKKIVEYNEDRDQVRDPYLVKNKDGKRATKADSSGVKSYVLKDEEGDKDELTNLLNDVAVDTATIVLDEYLPKIKSMYDALVNYDQNLSGNDAMAYEILVDGLEPYFEDKKGDK